MRTEKKIMDEITELTKVYQEKRWALLKELRESEYARITGVTIVD